MELIKEKEPTQLKYPVDWEMLNLGKSSVLKARIGWQGLTTAEYLDAGDYYLITGTDFKHGYIDWDNCVYVEKLRYDQDKNIQVKEDDVLVTKDGTIGKVAFVNNVPKKTTLNSGVFVIRPVHKSYYPRYFYYVLMSEHFKEFLGKLTAGSTISHLYQKDFVHYEFSLPPTLTEQKAIATALSDVDVLITSLEQTITKKKAIKQGAMQALLNGKIRLNGFGETKTMKESEFGLIPEDWDVKLLPEVFDYIHGKAHEQHIDSTGIFTVVNSKFISTEGKVTKYSKENFCSARKGDILTVLSDLPNGKALVKTYYVNTDNKYAVNQRICIWRSKKDSPLYLSYIMNRHKYFMKFDDGVTQTHILNHHIEKCPVLVPRDTNEQKAIGEALNLMDAEITQLETKKEKYQAIKQGMMQELLTGKTRLI
tara:strand:- start:5715 stop:6983 length:1269 start_codon:yes stop_codon:yes gene_type:complete